MRASSFTLSDFLSGLGQGDPACVYRHGHSTALERSACFIRLELGKLAIGPERGRKTIIQEIHRDYAVVLAAIGHTFLDCRRSEEHTSDLQSLMSISYAVFCLKKKNKTNQ